MKPWTAGNDKNLADANSGWDAVADGYDTAKGGNQYLHLSPAQSLAYVRDRDSLPNGDLDRTHRQQAVLDYVIWKTENSGLLSDLGQLTALLGTAKKYLITDQDWNLFDFADQHEGAVRQEPAVLHRADHRLPDHRRPGGQQDRHPDDPGRDQGEVQRPRARREAVGSGDRQGGR